jgi:two-component system alkaline phosphatase synthesis response regulator PhoP
MSKTRILIVEDEPSMVAGLRDNFEFEGYEVVTAGDGEAGLERALADSPDLVILDVMMPKMSGLDVCKQLKSKRPSCSPRAGRRWTRWWGSSSAPTTT